jgi:hypothetical protein
VDRQVLYPYVLHEPEQKPESANAKAPHKKGFAVNAHESDRGKVRQEEIRFSGESGSGGEKQQSQCCKFLEHNCSLIDIWCKENKTGHYSGRFNSHHQSLFTFYGGEFNPDLQVGLIHFRAIAEFVEIYYTIIQLLAFEFNCTQLNCEIILKKVVCVNYLAQGIDILRPVFCARSIACIAMDNCPEAI